MSCDENYVIQNGNRHVHQNITAMMKIYIMILIIKKLISLFSYGSCTRTSGKFDRYGDDEDN